MADQRKYQKRQYLVKQKGYSPTEATWEPLVHIKDTTALSDYLQEKKRKKGQIMPEDVTPLVLEGESNPGPKDLEGLW